MIPVFSFNVDWKKIPPVSDGVHILRIAHAVNDIACASHFMLETAREDAALPEYLRNGYQLYCIRLISSHLDAAIELVGEIKNHAVLKPYIARLSAESEQDYKHLLTLQMGGTNRADFEKYVGNVRDKLTSHYDKKQVRDALKDITESSQTGNAIIVAEQQAFSRLILADTVMRWELCAVIWQVPATASNEEIEKELMQALDWWDTQVKAFLNFGTELCVAYFRDRVQQP